MDLDDLTPSQIAIVIILIAAFLFCGAIGVPQCNKYRRTVAGEATLEAEKFETQVAIEEAQAKRDAAVFLAEAEVIRAQGVADSNVIIGEGLGGAEAYLRYLWIQGLQDGSSEVIYIATEAGLPILEARDR